MKDQRSNIGLLVLAWLTDTVVGASLLDGAPSDPEYINWYHYSCPVGINVNCSNQGSVVCPLFPHATTVRPLHYLNTNADDAGKGLLWAINTDILMLYDADCVRYVIESGTSGLFGLVLTSTDQGWSWNFSANSSSMTAFQSSAAVHRVNATDVDGAYRYEEGVCIVGGYNVLDDAFNVSTAVSCAWATDPTTWYAADPLPQPTYSSSVATFHGRLIVIGGWRDDGGSSVWASEACLAWPCKPASNWQVVLAASPLGYRFKTIILSSIYLGSCVAGIPDHTRQGNPSALFLSSGLNPNNPTLVGQDVWTVTDVANASTWVQQYDHLPVSVFENALMLFAGEFGPAPPSNYTTITTPRVFVMAEPYAFAWTCGGDRLTQIPNNYAWETPPTRSLFTPMDSDAVAHLVMSTDANGMPFVRTRSIYSSYTIYPATCAACGDGMFSGGCLASPTAPKCFNCKLCLNNTYTADNCSTYNDAFCRTCSSCKPRQFIAQACSVAADTVCGSCAVCPTNTSFTVSNCTSDANTVCKTCAVCPPGTTVLQECGPYSDRICNSNTPEALGAAGTMYLVALSIIGAATLISLVIVPRYAGAAKGQQAASEQVPLQPRAEIRRTPLPSAVPPAQPARRTRCRGQLVPSAKVLRAVWYIVVRCLSWIFLASAIFVSFAATQLPSTTCTTCAWVLFLTLLVSPVARLGVARFFIQKRVHRYADLRRGGLTKNGLEAVGLPSWPQVMFSSAHFRTLSMLMRDSDALHRLGVVEWACVDVPVVLFLFVDLRQCPADDCPSWGEIQAALCVLAVCGALGLVHAVGWWRARIGSVSAAAITPIGGEEVRDDPPISTIEIAIGPMRNAR
jgi:hypothetical protein